tara:strand:- start:16879 stop:18201 length:1323 start_codon:yes stop_codon:yes gene_type:complete
MARETLKNNNIIEILGKNSLTNVTTKTINSGFTNEKKIFTVSGRVKKGKPSAIGTIKLTAAENKRFIKAPGIKAKSSNSSLSLNSYLKLHLSSVEKDASKNITTYLYDLIYTGKEKITKTNKLKYNLTNEAARIVTKTLGIIKVDIGRNIIKPSGEKRRIIIHGDPNSSVKINVSNIVDYVDTAGEITNSIESSILSDRHKSEKLLNGHDVYNVKKINSSGKYIFIQEFPKVTADTKYSINFLPVTKNRNFTAKSWSTTRSPWEGYYSKVLTQSVGVSLTLRVSTSKTLYKINEKALVSIGGGRQAFDLVYRGIYGTSSSKRFAVRYRMKVDNTSHGFALQSGASGADLSGTLGLPVFSYDDSSKSDWSNSVHGVDQKAGVSSNVGNGGTRIEISKITGAVNSSTNDEAELTIFVEIHKFGTKNVIMDLDMDDVFDCSTR